MARGQRHRGPAQARRADRQPDAVQRDLASLRETAEQLRVGRVNGPEGFAGAFAVPRQFPGIARDDRAPRGRCGFGGADGLVRGFSREIHRHFVDQRVAAVDAARADAGGNGPLLHQAVEERRVVDRADHAALCLAHVAAQIHGRAGREMRKHIRAGDHAEEIGVAPRVEIRTVVVGVLKDAVPPLERTVRAQHRLALSAVLVRERMVILADGVGLALHALCREADDAGERIHHGLVADRPFGVHARMAPVRMAVHVIQLRLKLRRAVTELRAGDRRLRLQIFFHVVSDAGPVGVLRLPDEPREIGPGLRGREIAAFHDRHAGGLDA